MTDVERASNHWVAEDVVNKAEEMGLHITQAEADELLVAYEHKIIDAMVEAGWIVIEDMLEREKK